MDKHKSFLSKSLKIERKIDRGTNQIVSPLAKYDSSGRLFCIICKSCIKSASIWKVHVNSKLHRQNVEEAKNVDKQILQKSLQSSGKIVQESQASSNMEKFNTKKAKEPVRVRKEVTSNQTPKQEIKSKSSVVQEASDVLPEMFFDDPVVDAKIHQVEFKNIQNEEWERFQREIKEESISSNKLIFGEQTNSALDREITEISEQIHHWSKVIDLENKLTKIVKREKCYKELDDTDDNKSDDEVNDFLDWRSKKFI